MKEIDEFILFFKIVLGKIASAARNLINSAHQSAAMTLVFCIYPSSMSVGLYVAESPKQGSKSFNSFTKTIHFSHLGILFIYRLNRLCIYTFIPKFQN